MSDIDELTKIVKDFRDQRDWKQFHNPKDCSLSLMLEAAEVAEHFQWKSKAEMQEHLRSHGDEVAEELADVLYFLLLMAHDFDINLPKAFKSKMRKNAKKYPVNKSKGRHTKYNQL